MQEELVAKNWRDFIRPRRLELEDESHNESYKRLQL